MMSIESLFTKSLFPIMLSAIYLQACKSSDEKINPVKHIVEIKEMRFQPAQLSIRAGDTIEWVNHDLVDHDVTEMKNRSWSSGILNNNKRWQRVINGTTDYFCSIHVVMKGKLIVDQ